MITEFIPQKYRKPLRFSQLAEVNEAPQVLHAIERPLIIGPRRDPVFRYLHEEFADRAHFVSWEKFRTGWDYRYRDNRIRLVADGHDYPVGSIYLRAYESSGEDPHFRDMLTFLQLLTTIKQRKIGTTDLGISNTSKVLHLHSAVREAARGLSSIAMPETLMIKSDRVTSHMLARLMGPSVAKSLSSTRTQVFDDETFKYFTRHRPAHVPVIIQKKKVGMEVRVHCVGGEVFPLGIRDKRGGVDYRYSSDIEVVHDVTLTDQELEFCHRIQKIEANPLIGVDFIRDGDKTYCFEANPNPGWASFDYEPEVKRRLATAVFRYLERG